MTTRSITNQELRELPLLAELADEQLAKVQKTMRLITLKDNQHLFEQGESAERFYHVLSGQIKLFRISIEGSERVIEVVQPGQTFAEAVMFMDKKRYPLHAEAIGETELLAFDSTTFLKILEDSKQACFRLLADMSMRLHNRLNEIDYLTFQNATFRMVHYLLQQIPKGNENTNSIEIQLITSKSIIASRLSIQPETFSRILKSLSKRGLIEVKGKTIKLLDINGLRNYEA